MRQKIQVLRLLGLASLFLFGLSGCGIKGPLYLPAPDNAAPPAAKAKAPAAGAKAGDDNKQESSK